MAAGEPLVGEWKCRWMSGISCGSSGMCTWALMMDPGEEAEAYGAEAEAGTERGEPVGVAWSPPAREVIWNAVDGLATVQRWSGETLL